MSLDKRTLRKDMLKKRNSMTSHEVESQSKIIISKLVNLDEFKSSENIMIYLSYKNEVDTNLLLDICLEESKKVIVPLCIEGENRMIPCEIKDPKKELQENSMGIKEPHKELAREVNVKSIDLVIVPGVVFDLKGNRIGFGGGYYDRFLKLATNAKSIALCYDYQIIDNYIPAEDFDISMEKVITEKKIINF